MILMYDSYDKNEYENNEGEVLYGCAILHAEA